MPAGRAARRAHGASSRSTPTSRRWRAAAIEAGAVDGQRPERADRPRGRRRLRRAPAPRWSSPTHARGRRRSCTDPHYDDVVEDVKRFLAERLEQARALGVDDEQLIAVPGPGHGQGPRADDRAAAPARTSCTSSGRPLLLAVSRKDFVGALTGAPPARAAGRHAGRGRARRGARRARAARARRRRGARLPDRARGARTATSRSPTTCCSADELRWEPTGRRARRRSRRGRMTHRLRSTSHRAPLGSPLRLAALPARPARPRDRGDQRAAAGGDGGQRRPHHGRLQAGVRGRRASTWTASSART